MPLGSVIGCQSASVGVEGPADVDRVDPEPVEQLVGRLGQLLHDVVDARALVGSARGACTRLAWATAEMPELGVEPRSTGNPSGSRCSTLASTRSRAVIGWSRADTIQPPPAG